MKLNTQTIAGQLDEFQVALEDRSYVLAVAFARAIAYALPLPTSPVDNPYQAFAEMHKAGVEAMAADVNERVVFDTDRAVELTGRIWIFRFRMVYDANNTAVREFLDAMIKVGSRELPPQLSEIATKYAQSDAIDRMSKFVSASIQE